MVRARISGVASIPAAYSLNLANFTGTVATATFASAPVSRGGFITTASTVTVAASIAVVTLGTDPDNALFIQIGNYDSQNQRLAMTFGNMTALGLGLQSLNISTRGGH